MTARQEPNKRARPRLKREGFAADFVKQRYMQLFVLLGMAFLLVFYYSPMAGIIMAFKDYRIQTGYVGIFTSKWAGFKWFVEFFTDYKFETLVKNTLAISVLKLVFTFPIPILLSIMLNEVRNRKIKRVVQTASYLPYFISWVVVAGFCLQFLSTNDGLVNIALMKLGLTEKGLNLLTGAQYYWGLAVATGAWKEMGWWTIIFLAAIAGVDPSLHEAAVIDGAGRLQRIRHIVLPGIMPTITIVLILAIGNLLGGGMGGSSFEQSLLLGNMGNNETSDIIQSYSFRVGLQQGRYAYATAVGMVQSVISVLLIYFSNLVAKKTTGNSLF
jgi:putative aldouronate transport system permease protein